MPRDRRVTEYQRAKREHKYLLTYQEVSDALNYSPAYIKFLCDTGKLTYVVKTWRYGVYMRRKRYVPRAEVMRWWVEHFRCVPRLR